MDVDVGSSVMKRSVLVLTTGRGAVNVWTEARQRATRSRILYGMVCKVIDVDLVNQEVQVQFQTDCSQ